MNSIPLRQVARAVGGAPRCRLAESPRWSGGTWWWVDAIEGRVWSATIDMSTGVPLATAALGHDFGVRTSLVQPVAPQRLLIARGSEIVETRADGEGLEVLAEVPLSPGDVLNDGVADHDGSLFIGSVGADPERSDGAIWTVSPTGSVSVFARGFSVSNGMALAPDGDLWHADSRTGIVWLHRRDSSGSHAGSEVFHRFDRANGMPDGLAADGRGGVWVALYGTGTVVRLDARAAITHEVRVPTPQVTGIALGGEDSGDLLIATAREGFDRRQSEEDPAAGCLFLARDGE